jgi:methyl-accepting chemotaxis protein
MTFGLKGSRFAFLRLNLGPKAVLSAAILIAVNTALVVGAGSTRARNAISMLTSAR